MAGGAWVLRSLIKEAGIATSLGVVVAYFGWYQMHAKVQSGKIKTYYEQNPTTGEQLGQ